MGDLNKVISINSSGQILGKAGDVYALWQNGNILQFNSPEEVAKPTKTTPVIANGAGLTGLENIVPLDEINAKMQPVKKVRELKPFVPICLNDAEQVVGQIDDKAFLWSRNELKEIDTKEMTKYFSYNEGINFIPLVMNKLGAIAGKFGEKVVVIKNNSWTPMNEHFKELPNTSGIEITGINDYGQMIVYFKSSSTTFSYLLTPISKVPILILGKDKGEAVSIPLLKIEGPSPEKDIPKAANP